MLEYQDKNRIYTDEIFLIASGRNFKEREYKAKTKINIVSKVKTCQLYWRQHVHIVLENGIPYSQKKKSFKKT
jgi:hypothetical protein